MKRAYCSGVVPVFGKRLRMTCATDGVRMSSSMVRADGRSMRTWEILVYFCGSAKHAAYAIAPTSTGVTRKRKNGCEIFQSNPD